MEALDRREVLLEEKIDEQVEKAKQYMAANKKPMALNCMKMKKQYEDQIESIQKQRMNLFSILNAREMAEMNRVSMLAQQRALEELAFLNSQVNPEKVEAVLEQVQDHVQQVKDANNALANPIDMEMADDDEAEQALKELLRQEQKKVNVATTKPVASSVSVEKKQKSTADVDAERELAKLMNGVNIPSTKPILEKADASKSMSREEEELLAQLQME
jgi:charged multivesicular body protein 4